MSSPIKNHKLFSFKQFSLTHSQCAMKIGTDGVLLGAWAEHLGQCPCHILDVGCGCGIISLMVAQRYSTAHITGLDIDDGAISDALENVKNSPWSDRVEIIKEDFFTHSPAVGYDMIISNPPFYTASVHSPVSSRDTARNAIHFPIDKFAKKCSEILTPSGSVSIIYPFCDKERVCYAFYGYGLYNHRITHIKDSDNTAIKRVLLSFSPARCEKPMIDELVIRGDDGLWSYKYKCLTQDFHPQIEL